MSREHCTTKNTPLYPLPEKRGLAGKKDNLVDDITAKIKRKNKNKTIKRNPKLNRNRGVAR